VTRRVARRSRAGHGAWTATAGPARDQWVRAVCRRRRAAHDREPEQRRVSRRRRGALQADPAGGRPAGMCRNEHGQRREGRDDRRLASVSALRGRHAKLHLAPVVDDATADLHPSSCVSGAVSTAPTGQAAGRTRRSCGSRESTRGSRNGAMHPVKPPSCSSRRMRGRCGSRCSRTSRRAGRASKT
jgi:hypothetical protein